MKKIITILLLTLGLTAGALAHHNSPAENAGMGLPEDSMHNFIFTHNKVGSENLYLAHHNSPAENAGRGMPSDSMHYTVFG